MYNRRGEYQLVLWKNGYKAKTCGDEAKTPSLEKLSRALMTSIRVPWGHLTTALHSPKRFVARHFVGFSTQTIVARLGHQALLVTCHGCMCVHLDPVERNWHGSSSPSP